MLISPGRLIYLAKRRAKLGWHHWYAERCLSPRITQWRVNLDWPMAPLPLHLLASKHDWELALWMLVSFHHFTARRWSLVLHEDGSLGDEIIGVFSRLFPGLRVIQRRTADAVISKRLSGYPRCADYRARMPHGLKCFDIPQMAESKRFLLLDPDVLFFGKPTELLAWVDKPGDLSCWFNRDFQEPSPISPEQALADFGVRLWPSVNSGFCLLTRDNVTNLDAMESWLGHPLLQQPKVQWRVEQTLMALSASKFGQGGLLPETYEVSPGKHRRPDSVARHYVGCVRDRFLGEGVFDISKSVLSAETQS